MLLATGAVDAAKGVEEGLAPVTESEMLSLRARVQSVRLLSSGGNVIVFGGPKTLDLLDLASVAALLSSTTVPAGEYTGVELVLTQGTLVLADAPLDTIDLVLAGNGVYTLNFPFEVAEDSSGLLYLELGGLNVFRQENDTYLLAPDLSAALRETVANARLEGTVESVNNASETFELAAGAASFTVDYDGAAVFLPSDFDTPTGTPANLVPETRLAVIGAVGLSNTMAPNTIQILDLPGTPTNEEGELVTVCYVYGDDPVLATTLEISRSRLDFVLAQGGFEGSCEGGDPFTLTYAAGPGGTIDGETPQRVLPGEDGTPVTAVPEEGFAFVNWSDGSILNPRTDTAVGASISVTANFTSLFALSYSAGEGGTLVGETSQFVPEGGNGSPVTAVRNEGFIFQQWSDGSTDNPRTDLNVTADISVTASFARIYTLTYNATAGGTLDGATLQSVLGGEDGTPVTAIPGEGFVFTGWSDGNTDNPRTDLDVMANLTVTANFVAQFTLNYAAGNNGTLAGETTQIVNAGSSGTPVTAVASEGFGFVAWSDGRTDNPRTDANVQGNLSVTASFATSVFLTYAAGPNGTLTGNVEQEIGAGGTSSAVTAVPNEGFLFNRWSDGRVDNPRVDEEVTSNLSVTAEFVEAFTLSYSAEENGSLTGTTTQIVKRGAAGTAVTAVPSSGFAFRRWSDGSTQNPRTDVNVLADLSVSASFIQLFSVTYTAGPNGSITGSRVQSVRDGMDGRPVTAVPNENFGFLGWSDGRLDNPRTDLNVAANISVTANFGTDVTITYVAGENGALTGTTTQEVSVGDSTTPVTAVPDEGHVFLQWNDGSTQNPRSDAFVNATVNLTASFLKIPVMLHVPAGTFTMGRLDEGDDGTFGLDDELPRRDVTLSEYEIGKYEISVREYNEFLNYLHHPSRNLLRRQDNQVWEGPTMGDLYYERGGFHMIYSGRLGETETIYNPETRLIEPKPLPGLPEGTIYSMIDHPVNQPTWYGAALYTNWLSERAGLEPVYDPDTWEADFTKNGYRLPTEAEWERAAAWDGEKHWIYPITSDTLEGRARVNYHDGPPVPTTEDPLLNTYFVNPLGLVQTRITAFTSPVGWFNGINISPNRNIQTIDSKSPVGAYDMAGNLIEWCQDWYDPGYYAVGGTVDPMGPDGGTHKVARGGAWGRTPMAPRMRSSARYSYLPTFTDGIIGFRIARSVR